MTNKEEVASWTKRISSSSLRTPPQTQRSQVGGVFAVDFGTLDFVPERPPTRSLSGYQVGGVPTANCGTLAVLARRGEAEQDGQPVKESRKDFVNFLKKKSEKTKRRGKKKYS